MTNNYSFAAHSIHKPGVPHDGDQLDKAFAAAGQKTDHLSQKVAKAIRDDGQLKNGIVTKDSLANDLATELSGHIKADITPQIQIVKDHAHAAKQSAQQAADQATIATTKSGQAHVAQQAAQQAADQSSTNADDAEAFALAAKEAWQASEQAEQQAEQAATLAEQHKDGAIAAYGNAKQAADTAMAAVGPAAAHINQTDNPHNVTHEQVGARKPHWNAGFIKGKPISVDNRKTDGLQRVVVWDPAKDHYTHAVFSALAGGGLKYPINWANEGEGRILVLRDDGNGGFVWVLEPKPQKGKKGVNEFVDLADTPAVIEAGKALIGHDENGLKSLIWTEIYTKLEIDGLLVPINTRLDQLQLLFSQLQDRLDLQDSKITDLINQITNIENRLTQIENNNQQGGGNTQINHHINKAQAANRWHVWAGI